MAWGALAKLNKRRDAGPVVSSRVRRLRRHEIKT
jgi:hypothetical protein